MKRRSLISAAVAILLSATVVTVGLHAKDQQDPGPAHYYVFNLGIPGGGTASVGNTINDLGWPMGTSNVSGDASEHATVWIPGTSLDLGTLGGPNSAVVFPNRNNTGEVVGIAETASTQPLGEYWSCALAFFPTITGKTCLGFVWQNGTMTPLSTLGGDNAVASAVNNAGQVVGWAETNFHDPTCNTPQVLQFKATLWDPNGQIQALPQFGNDPDSAAVAINNYGQIVGISGICSNAIGGYSAIHAVLWQNGRVFLMGDIGGHGWNTPVAINDNGEVVGFANASGDIVNGSLTIKFHAFLWTKGRGMVDLGTLPGDALSEATGINNEGEIVGTSYGAGFTHPRAFIYEDGKMTPLNSLVAGPTTLSLVVTGDINDEGEITGEAVDSATGEAPAFLAVPLRSEGAWSQSDVNGAAELPLAMPESVHQMILRRHGLNNSTGTR
jgi:probable HAF family extracellular repeat protein